MSEGIIQPNEPITFQARNPYPRYSRLKDGDCFKVTLEVSEKDWQALKTMPPNAILEVMLWHHDGDGRTMEEATGGKEKLAKKAKKESGPYGKYWSQMFASGFNASFDLIEVLQVDTAEQVKEALHKIFITDSLTHVSPYQFEQWADHHNLQMQITLSRQAAVKAGATV